MATLDTVATRPSGASHADGKAYFETSTNQFIVWDATDGEWIQLDSDGTGSYAFNIDIRDTEANILAMTPTEADADNAVVAYATDTHDFYIYDGSAWYIYNNDYLFSNNTYSLSFDGSNDYVDTNSNSLDSSVWSGSFSISVWYKTPSSLTGKDGMFLTTGRFASGVSNLEFRATEQTIYLWFTPSSNTGGSPFNAYDANTVNVLSPNTWYHICWTADRPSSGSTTSKLYLNGVSQSLTHNFLGSIHNATPFSSGNDLILGARNGASTEAGSTTLNLEGLVDELAIFNTALSSSDVTAIYNNGVPAEISSLNPVSWWRMGDDDSGTGIIITDRGSGGNNGTLINGPIFSTSVPQ